MHLSHLRVACRLFVLIVRMCCLAQYITIRTVARLGHQQVKYNWVFLLRSLPRWTGLSLISAQLIAPPTSQKKTGRSARPTGLQCPECVQKRPKESTIILIIMIAPFVLISRNSSDMDAVRKLVGALG